MPKKIVSLETVSPSRAVAYTLALYMPIFFITLVSFIVYKTMIGEWDSLIASFMYSLRSPFLLFFFFVITWTGKWYVVFLLVAACSAVMYRSSKLRGYIISFLVVIAGTGSSVWALKLFFHRSRPGGLLPSYIENTYSFPSGHSAIAIALYGFLIYILLRQRLKTSMRVLVALGGFLLIVLIGLSRLYLGVHYMSDVWGGYVLGGAWVVIGMMIAESQKK